MSKMFTKIPITRHMDGVWTFRHRDVVMMVSPPRDIWKDPLVVIAIDSEGVHVLNVEEGDGTRIPASRLKLVARATLSPLPRIRRVKGYDVN